VEEGPGTLKRKARACQGPSLGRGVARDLAVRRLWYHHAEREGFAAERGQKACSVQTACMGMGTWEVCTLQPSCNGGLGNKEVTNATPALAILQLGAPAQGLSRGPRARR